MHDVLTVKVKRILWENAKWVDSDSGIARGNVIWEWDFDKVAMQITEYFNQIACMPKSYMSK